MDLINFKLQKNKNKYDKVIFLKKFQHEYYLNYKNSLRNIYEKLLDKDINDSIY